MTVETIRMSSKGQIVIPQDIREELHLGEGSLFVVAGTENTIMLKKVNTPDKDDLIRELKSLAIKSKKKLQKKGFGEKDLWTK